MSAFVGITAELIKQRRSETGEGMYEAKRAMQLEQLAYTLKRLDDPDPEASAEATKRVVRMMAELLFEIKA